ncbi:MAG: 23S rRNA (uracil(1939)-C(5))-methyltransferase RlmD [Catonella sp.]|jgi:23S rRNA (uracil1939-C5)-methyltransferase|nr:23S rRNA (uracil(1939)-C(5))-methyltransferase RlmD [Catonella sp.]
MNITCPYIKKCGACSTIGRPYGGTLNAKEQTVSHFIGKYVKPDKILGMKEPYHYRNKVHAVFGKDRYNNLVTGTYGERSHDLVPVAGCLIENERADKIIETVCSLANEFRLKAYDEDRQTGFLRHILVRTCHTTGEIMLVLVTADFMFPGKKNFAKELKKRLPGVTTFLINVNKDRTNMILGRPKDTEVVYGKGKVTDILCGKRFIIGPDTFYQVNSEQTERLYNMAIELAELTGKEKVLDAYCGIGTIGIIASDKAGTVTGVELNNESVLNAKENARINACKNIEFISGDAGLELTKRVSGGDKKPFDVIFMDPPRAGASEEFLASAIAAEPDKIIYVSCNPETLGRDLGILTKAGYKAEKAVPVDMFPWTDSVECVVKLTR